MAEVGKLSASKLTTYKGCSLAYYLKYAAHEKVPLNVRAAFGKAIHYMLDRFYDVNYKSADSFAGFWRYYWSSLVAGEFLKGKQKAEVQTRGFSYFGKDKETGKRVEKCLNVGNHVYLGPDNTAVGIFFGYMRLGEDILKRFYLRHKQLPAPKEREKAFGNKKDEPFDINGHLVTGVFDRIDEKNGDWFIADYKTDKSSPEKDSFILHRHPQFTLYSYAFRKIFGCTENAVLYYHLRTGCVFKTHRSDKDFDYMKKLLDEVSGGISGDKFVPFYGFHCNFCDYKVPCEKYSIPHHGGPRIDLEGKIIEAEKFTEWDTDAPEWIEMQAEER